MIQHPEKGPERYNFSFSPLSTLLVGCHELADWEVGTNRTRRSWHDTFSGWQTCFIEILAVCQEDRCHQGIYRIYTWVATIRVDYVYGFAGADTHGVFSH